MSNVDPNLRAQIRAAIEADYGEHTILPGNKMPRPRRLPTRSPALDYITGGGWPFRNMSRLWGGFSSTKSLCMLNAFWCAQNFGNLRYKRLKWLSEMAFVAGEAREAKKLMDQAKREQSIYAGGLKCMYVCVEGAIDTQYMVRNLGLDLSGDKFELVMPPTAKRIETVGDIVQKALAGYHVIVIDSTSSGVSIDEFGHKSGIYGSGPERAMQRAAKWGVNLAWWGDRMNDDNVLLYSSQIRSKIGMGVRQKIDAEEPPGGKQLEHDSAVTLHFMKGGWLKSKGGKLVPMSEDSKGGIDVGAFGKTQAAGTEIIVRCEKNRFGKSHRVALLQHHKNRAQFDFLHELEKLAKYFRVVNAGASGWVTLPDGSKTQNVRSYLEENPDLVRQIEDTTIRCAEDPDYEEKLLAGRGGPGESLAEVA